MNVTEDNSHFNDEFELLCLKFNVEIMLVSTADFDMNKSKLALFICSLCLI